MRDKYDDKELYRKQILKEDKDLWSDKDLVKEAVKQSNEMNRRLARIEKNYPRSDLIKTYKKQPDPSDYVKDGKVDRSAVSNILAEAYRFNKNPTTTMKGFRKQLSASVKSFNKQMQELDDEGNLKTPRIFTSKNIWDLYDFLDDYREYWKNQEIPASDEVVDIFVQAKRLNMKMDSVIENMNTWRKNKEKMKDFTPIESDKPVPSSEYEKLLSSK